MNIIKFDRGRYDYDEQYYYDAIVEVENTGSTNIYLTGLAFDIEDDSGHLVQSDSMISTCPDVIRAGEKGYLYNSSFLNDEADIHHIHLVPQYIVKTTAENQLDYEVSDVSFKDDTFGLTTTGRITNQTDEDDSYVYVEVIYYDKDQHVLGITGTSVTDLFAGRTVSFEISSVGLHGNLKASDVSYYHIYARKTFWGL